MPYRAAPARYGHPKAKNLLPRSFPLMGQICLFSHGLQYHGILRRHLPARTDHKKDTDLPSRFLPSIFTEDNDFNQKLKKTDVR